jgi:uncharacterized repeat protein (TIGR02543 family)
MVFLALPAITASAAPPIYSAVTFYQNDSVPGAAIGQEADAPTALLLISSLGSTFNNPGYVFVEWSTTFNNASGSATYTDGQIFDFASKVSLYAQWAPVPASTLTFAGNGATGSISSVTGDDGNSVTLPTGADLTYPGYTFAGWNTAPGGEGISYSVGGTITLTTSLSLYAQWTETNYVVDFLPNGGTVSPTTTSFNVDTGTVALPTPTYPGHTFNGWFTTASGGTLVGLGGSSTVLAASTDLYAQWTATNYVVDFLPNGGTVSPTTTSFNVDTGTVALPTPTYPGYTFNGWFTAASGGTLVGLGGSSTVLAASTDLYAQWTVIVVAPVQVLNSTISFADNGGVGSVADVSGANGTSVTLPGGIGMSYVGKSFASWNTAANGSGTPYNVDAPLKLDSSFTLFAQWDTLLPSKATSVLLGAVGTFSAKSSKLSTALKVQVKRLASLVKTGGYARVTLYGYSTDSGTAPQKLSISRSRANAVAGYLRTELTAQHVKGVSIDAAGEGSIKGKVSAVYRRVEVFVTSH